MAKAKTAKTAIKSKNDPGARGKAQDYFWNGKKIKAIKFIGTNVSYMAGAYDEPNGDVITDPNGNPYPWKALVS